MAEDPWAAFQGLADKPVFLTVNDKLVMAGARQALVQTLASEDRLRNPWGILHGGVVAMLVDLAAEHATGGVTTDVVLHYLAPNRTGPVRAVVRPVARRSDGTVCRVEVTDTAADRVTALAITTSGPRPIAPIRS